MQGIDCGSRLVYDAAMRGDDQQTGHLFSYVSPEARVPHDHPLRAIRRMTDEALGHLAKDFDRLYATTGRPSIPQEQLLRALCGRCCTPCGVSGC
jgi:hypothetical protein